MTNSANMIEKTVATINEAVAVIESNFGKVSRNYIYVREAGDYNFGTVAINEDDDAAITFCAYSDDEADADFRCSCGKAHNELNGVLEVALYGEVICVITVCEHGA